MFSLLFFSLIYPSLALSDSNLIANFEKKEQAIYKSIPDELLLSLAQDARVRGKIIGINDNTVKIYDNQVFFLTLTDDLCRQVVFQSPDKYTVHTLCFRNDTILIEYISNFKRNSQ